MVVNGYLDRFEVREPHSEDDIKIFVKAFKTNNL